MTDARGAELARENARLDMPGGVPSACLAGLSGTFVIAAKKAFETSQGKLASADVAAAAPPPPPPPTPVRPKGKK